MINIAFVLNAGGERRRYSLRLQKQTLINASRGASFGRPCVINLHKNINIVAVVDPESARLVHVDRAEVVGVHPEGYPPESAFVKAVLDHPFEGLFAVAFVLHFAGDRDAPFGLVALDVEELGVADELPSLLLDHRKHHGVLIELVLHVVPLLLLGVGLAPVADEARDILDVVDHFEIVGYQIHRRLYKLNSLGLKHYLVT